MDKKAKNILFKTYWKNGWIDKPHTDPADFAYARSKGLMFDPLTITHDEILDKLSAIIPSISTDTIAKAFLSSLSSGRSDLRSGLASLFIAKQLPIHPYGKTETGRSYGQNGQVTHISYTCGICRDSKYGIIGAEAYHNVDLNVLNFERIKWGGIRHGQLDYTLFDLQQLLATDIPEPTAEDVSIFKSILSVIENSQPGDHPGKLEKNLQHSLKSTKDERKILIEILACIEILQPQNYDRPSHGKSDWRFAAYWRGEDKYNKTAVQKYFGGYLV
jgi:hypothetical protein